MQRKTTQILVVDDDPTAQLDTVKFLQQRNYTVTCAWTLQDAYNRIVELPIDLVISGTRVGSMNGLQFIVSCRAKRPEVAGMVIAAQREHVSEMDAWRHGITPVIRPLDPSYFLMLVAEKLATVRPRQRWPRKKVSTFIPLQVGRTRAQLLDVSYGGLRFQLEGESVGLVPRSAVQAKTPSPAPPLTCSRSTRTRVMRLNAAVSGGPS